MTATRTITSPDHPTFEVQKTMFPTEAGRLRVQTVVLIDGVELTINDLRHMLREAHAFDDEWRAEAGLSLSQVKRIGTT